MDLAETERQTAEVRAELERIRRAFDEQGLSEYIPDDEPAAPEAKEDETDFYASTVVVDNLPAVPEAKYEKLLGVVKKIFSRIGALSATGATMPMEGGATLGFAFVDFAAPEDAQRAVNNLHDFQLDKKHKLRVVKYETFVRYVNTPDEYAAPEENEFPGLPDTQSWLQDGEARDQFVLRYGSETEVFWNESTIAPVLEYGGQREKDRGLVWCDRGVIWSPRGSYLVTFHGPGIALWGGPNWEKLARFAHRGVKGLAFSPQENYVVTVSLEAEEAVIVWSVPDGAKLRAFPQPGDGSPIPPFRFSADDRYVSRRGDGIVSVYELPGMGLLEKRSLRADGVREHQWSPSDSILAWWTPERGNTPASVAVVEMPSRRELRVRNLYHVDDCSLHFHPGGAYLCVKVLRHSKSGKTKYTSLELFRLRDPSVPVESIEIRDPVLSVSWEPEGSRLAVVHGDLQGRFSVSFYDMEARGQADDANECQLLYTLDPRPCNHVVWSPVGKTCVLAGLHDLNGALEFFDVENNVSYRAGEHFRANVVQFDPSGRFVATAVTQPIDADASSYRLLMDNGYRISSFQGQMLTEVSREQLYTFAWRPRPPSLLSAKDKKKVAKNLRKYERRFQEADRIREREERERLKAERKALRTDFHDLLERTRAALAERRTQAGLPPLSYDSDDEDDMVTVEVTKEVVLSQDEEPQEEF